MTRQRATSMVFAITGTRTANCPRQRCGLSPWPGAYCRYAGGRLKVWKSRVCEEAAAVGAIPGRIARLSAEGFVVETGDGLLELLEVQPENKRRMKASECACGYSLQPGDRLV